MKRISRSEAPVEKSFGIATVGNRRRYSMICTPFAYIFQVPLGDRGSNMDSQ